MRLIVNGAGRDLPGGVTVAELVRAVTTQERGLAVAVNGEVVLHDGDRVEVLSAAQGG